MFFKIVRDVYLNFVELLFKNQLNPATPLIHQNLIPSFYRVLLAAQSRHFFHVASLLFSLSLSLSLLLSSLSLPNNQPKHSHPLITHVRFRLGHAG